MPLRTSIYFIFEFNLILVVTSTLIIIDWHYTVMIHQSIEKVTLNSHENTFTVVVR